MYNGHPRSLPTAYAGLPLEILQQNLPR